jgi:uracil-DNA glycosylase
MPVMASRGKVFAGVHVERVFVTVHPSFLLRLPDEDARDREYNLFVRDLSAVKKLMEEA